MVLEVKSETETKEVVTTSETYREQGLLEQGEAHQHAGNYQAALNYYEQALAVNPRSFTAYFLASQAHERLEHSSAALNAISQALNLAPHSALAYRTRGVIYHNQGNLSAALVDYTQALELDPAQSLSWQFRGQLYSELNNYEKAIDDLNQALQLNPACSVCYFYRAKAQFYLSEFEDALSDCHQALLLNPLHTEAYYYRSQTYYFLHDYENALLDIKEACRLDPVNEDYQWQHTEIERKHAKSSAAQKLLEAVKANDYEQIETLLNQGANPYATKEDMLALVLAKPPEQRLAILQLFHAAFPRFIEGTNTEGVTLLVQAVALNDKALISWLLKQRESLTTDEEAEQAMELALKHGQDEIVDVLESYLSRTTSSALIKRCDEWDNWFEEEWLEIADGGKENLYLTAGSYEFNEDINKPFKGQHQPAMTLKRQHDEPWFPNGEWYPSWYCFKWCVRKVIKRTYRKVRAIKIPASLQPYVDILGVSVVTGLVWRRLQQRLHAFGTFPGVAGEIINIPEALAVYSEAENNTLSYLPKNQTWGIEEALPASSLFLAQSSDHPQQILHPAAPLLINPEPLPNFMLAMTLAKLAQHGCSAAVSTLTGIIQKEKHATPTTENSLVPEQPLQLERLRSQCQTYLQSAQGNKWLCYHLEDLLEEITSTRAEQVNESLLAEWAEALAELEADYFYADQGALSGTGIQEQNTIFFRPLLPSKPAALMKTVTNGSNLKLYQP